MTLSALLLMVLTRRLGLALAEIEQSRVSHGAILKQVGCSCRLQRSRPTWHHDSTSWSYKRRSLI